MAGLRSSVLLTTIVLALGGWPSSGAAQGSLKIGVVTDLSGSLALLGRPSLDGMQLALEEINKSGGLLGRRVELVIADSHGNPSQGVVSFKRLVEQEKLSIVLGPASPVVAAAIRPVASQFKVPLVIPGPFVQRSPADPPSRYVFYLTPDLAMEGTAAAISTRGRNCKTFVVVGPDVEASRARARAFSTAINRLQPMSKVVKEIWSDPRETDLSALVQSIKGENPDCVYSIYLATQAIRFLDAAKQSLAERIGVVQRVDHDLLAAFGAGMREGIVGLAMTSPNAVTASARGKTFVEQFRKRQNADPSDSAVVGYDSLFLAAQALTRAKTLEPERLVEALESGTFESLRGRIRFSSDHVAYAPMYFGIVKKATEGRPYVLVDVSTIPGETLFAFARYGVAAAAPPPPAAAPPPPPAAAPPTLGSTSPPPPRVYNAFFEEGGDANQRPHRLEPNRDYHLLFYIGVPAPQNILGHQPLSAYLRQRAAQGDIIDLDLVVICTFCAEPQVIQRRTVQLGTTGNTEAQRYALKPIRSGDFDLVLAVEFEHMTVQHFSLPVRVGTAAIASAAPVPIAALPRPPPQPMLADVRKLKPADLTITIVPRGTTQYRVDLRSRDGAINLENGGSLLEDDLKNTLKEMWQQLRVLVQNKHENVRFSQLEIDGAKFSIATRDALLLELARAGRALYNDLFRLDTTVLAKLSEFRARPTSAETPPLVRIATLGVFLPWALLYDGDPTDLNAGRVDLKGFWGYRYRLEGQLLDQEGSERTDALETYPLNLLYGFYSGGDQSFVQRRKDQEMFFRGFGQDVRLATVDSNQGLTAALVQKRKEIEALYLYAHGSGGQKSIWADSRGTSVEVWLPDADNAAIALSPVPPPGGLVPRNFTDIFVGGEPVRLEVGPIVFLNVCEGEANAAISLRNFVAAFMTIGARAVIASDAEVWQNFAQDYAQEFFRRLFDPRSTNDLSRIMFDLRRLYLDRDNNPFPFLYTLWGHGEYKVRRP